jgi:hypothetical protein
MAALPVVVICAADEQDLADVIADDRVGGGKHVDSQGCRGVVEELSAGREGNRSTR